MQSTSPLPPMSVSYRKKSQRFVAVVGVGLVAAACTATQPATPSLPIPPGQAGISITRTDEYVGSGVSVDVQLNGASIASIGRGHSYRGPVRPGPAVLTASTWSTPGRYTVQFNAEPNKTYAFVISARSEQFQAQALGGLIGLGADTANNGDQSGAFKITAVAP